MWPCLLIISLALSDRFAVIGSLGWAGSNSLFWERFYLCFPIWRSGRYNDILTFQCRENSLIVLGKINNIG